MKNEAVLFTEHLSVLYRKGEGDIQALSDLNLTLHKGEVIGLYGENGAGKTTAGLALCALLDRSTEVSGRIFFQGQPVNLLDSEECRSYRKNVVSYIPAYPDTALNPLRTILEQVREVFLTKGQVPSAADHSARLILRRSGFPEDHVHAFPGTLSGGMKQRAVIAMALAKEPLILIADEPTASLDTTVQGMILDLLKEIQEKAGMAMILISSRPEVLLSMCRRTLVLYCGKILEEGYTEEVFSRPAHPYTKGLIGSMPGFSAHRSRLSFIPGSAPDPFRLPEGCIFHERCSFCRKICEEEEPYLSEVSPDHYIRCFGE